MNKIKLASRFLDNGDEIVEVIIPETRIFVTVSAYEREYSRRSEKISLHVSEELKKAATLATWEQERC